MTKAMPSISPDHSVVSKDEVTPLISVVIPMYNREWCIADCLASIRGLEHLPAEVIVVDDGSRDASVERAHQAIADLGIGARTRLIVQENGGPGMARNRGAAEARGEWLVFFDSDDLWMPWTLETLADELAGAAPAEEMVFFSIRPFVDPAELPEMPEAEVYTVRPGDFLTATRKYPAIRYGSCNVGLRREAFQRVGGFSTELRCSEDTDLFLRIGGPTVLVTRPVMAGLRRSGHDSLTGNIPNIVRGFDHLVASYAAGVYPGATVDLQAFMSRACAYTIRTSFSSGWPMTAYRLYFSHLALLRDGPQKRYVWKLPATPLLHMVDPKGYPFRMRPR